ncbi:MAG: bifunctional riboflavin kinase/FAD synthetase [Bacteroidota bacterium]
MKVYNSLDEFEKVANGVVTIGTFDGVHIGHQRIISSLKQLAAEKNGETIVLTLFPHPRMVLFPDDNDLKLISTIEERIALFEKYGIDHLIVHPFTKEFSRQTATEFVRDILVNKMGTKTLVIGYDHRFGRHREGTFELLEELSPLYHFDLVEIPEQDVNNIAVSSTKIRTAILDGDITIANEFLAHDFEFSGKVIHGAHVGKSIGYPTANLEIADKYKLIPPEGIYAVYVRVDLEKFKGMLYIGNRPTLNGTKQSIEVNILDFNRDIYGKTITVVMKQKIRNDMKLNSLEELKSQIDLDKIETIKALSMAY